MTDLPSLLTVAFMARRLNISQKEIFQHGEDGTLSFVVKVDKTKLIPYLSNVGSTPEAPYRSKSAKNGDSIFVEAIPLSKQQLQFILSQDNYVVDVVTMEGKNFVANPRRKCVKEQLRVTKDEVLRFEMQRHQQPVDDDLLPKFSDLFTASTNSNECNAVIELLQEFIAESTRLPDDCKELFNWIKQRNGVKLNCIRLTMPSDVVKLMDLDNFRRNYNRWTKKRIKTGIENR